MRQNMFLSGQGLKINRIKQNLFLFRSPTPLLGAGLKSVEQILNFLLPNSKTFIV